VPGQHPRPNIGHPQASAEKIGSESSRGQTKRRNGSDTDAMNDLWDETDDGDVSPICAACGVSALPPEASGEPSMCENPNCSAFGELMGR
jgi:hypothetical protein